MIDGRLDGAGPRRLDNRVGHTLRGQGEIRPADFFNRGVTSADTPAGTLTIAPFSFQDFRNSGTLRAQNGGTLNLPIGLPHAIGGLVESLPDSTVVVDGVRITGGTVRSVPPSVFNPGTVAGAFRFPNPAEFESIAVEGPLTIDGTDQLILRKTIDNTAGQIAISGSAQLLTGSTSPTTTITGGSIAAHDNALANVVSSALADVSATSHDNARVRINAATITRGSLNGAGGRVEFAGTSSLTDVTLNGAAVIDEAASVTVRLFNSLTNNATWSLLGDGRNAIIEARTDLTIGGTGQIVLGGHEDNRIRPLGVVLTNAASHTIRGGGSLGRDSGGLINDGLIEADDPANLLIVDPGGLGFTNRSTMRAANGANLRPATGVYDNTAGVIEADGAGSRVSFYFSPTIRGGVLRGINGGVIRPGSLPIFDAVTFEGTVVQGNNADVTIRNGLINHATWSMDGNTRTTDIDLEGDQTIGGTGQIVMHGTDRNRINPTTDAFITHGAGHTIRGGGKVLLNDAALLNHGFLIADWSVPLMIDAASRDSITAASCTLKAPRVSISSAARSARPGQS